MELRPLAELDLELVARRMRLTLQEVLDPQRGAAMYTLEELRERVRAHLGPDCLALVATVDGHVVGHSMVREEPAGIALIATTYVQPEARRTGVASALVAADEQWALEHGFTAVRTATAVDNVRLRSLFASRGYRVVAEEEQMVLLERSLA